MVCALLAIGFRLCVARVYFFEEFGLNWTEKWVHSLGEGLGRFELTPGLWYVDEVRDRGIKPSSPNKKYAISSKFPVFNASRTFILQYTLKTESVQECGGGYVKLLPEHFNQQNFSSTTASLLTFGPDMCSFEKNLLIEIPYKGKKYFNKNKIKLDMYRDYYTHQYTLIIHSNNTLKVLIDNAEVYYGEIEDYFDIKFNGMCNEGGKSFNLVDCNHPQDSVLDYLYNIEGIGVEIWQVSPVNIFDNFFLGDDFGEAEAFSYKTFEHTKSMEPAYKETYDEIQAIKRGDVKFDEDYVFIPDNFL
jgi:Calreticulin family